MQSRLFNQERSMNISSYLVAGNTEKERNLGVSVGFPHKKLQRGEMITTKDIANVLGSKEGDTISAEFDLFQVISGDFAKLKRILYNFNTLG
jgi:hypothetical protein